MLGSQALFGADVPDPGAPETPLLIGALCALLAAAYGRLARKGAPWIRDKGEGAAFWGTLLGLVMYLFGLVTNLY